MVGSVQCDRRKAYGEEEDVHIRDIMTAGVYTVPANRSADDAWDMMRQYGSDHLVVTRGGRTVGVLSARDCGGRSGAAVRRGRTVDDLMSSPAVTVTSDLTAQRAATMMRGRSIDCLVVVDGERVVGIVTVSDLLELLGRGTGTRRVSEPRAALHHRSPHRKQHRPDGRW
jgi:acetoin utilization protein AcuB